MTFRSCFTGIAVAALLLAPALASAQDDPRKREAEQLYQEGLKLHDKDKEDDALDRFKKSYAIYPSPNTLVSIAREEQLLSKPLDALRHYREALKQPLLNPKNAALAKQYIVELEPRFGRVTVNGPSGTKLTIAGLATRLPMDEPLDVEPGNLAVEGDHDGKAFVGTATIAAGKVAMIELKPKDTATSDTTPPPPPSGNHDHVIEPPPVSPEHTSFWGWRSITGLSFVGVGLISLGAGLVFDGDRSTKQDKLDQLGRGLPPNGCAGVTGNAQCDQLSSAQSDRNAAASRTTAAFVTGGVALGVGAAFLASAVVWPHRRDTSAARIIPMAGPHQAGLLLGSDF